MTLRDKAALAIFKRWNEKILASNVPFLKTEEHHRLQMNQRALTLETVDKYKREDIYEVVDLVLHVVCEEAKSIHVAD